MDGRDEALYPHDITAGQVLTDEEQSYDAWFNGRPNGAFTYIALQALKRLPDTATYRDWQRKIRKTLPHISYPQTPQISGSWRQLAKWRVLVG